MNTPIYADLDQIVFENRSKEYGAYQMRKRYNRVLTRAMLIAFMLFLSITALPKMIDWMRPDEIAAVAPSDDGIPVIEDIPIAEKTEPEDEPEVPELPAPPVIDTRTIAVVIPVPTPEDELREQVVIAEVAELDSAAVGLVNNEGNPGEDYNWALVPPYTPGEGSVYVPPVDSGNGDPGSTTFVLLEKEPQAVNLDELKGMIGYPPMAKEAEIQGKVVVRVLIDSRGDYVKHIVLKDPHPILTKAVSDKISNLKMTPGIQAGKPIKVWVTLPFDFHLLN